MLLPLMTCPGVASSGAKRKANGIQAAILAGLTYIGWQGIEDGLVAVIVRLLDRNFASMPWEPVKLAPCAWHCPADQSTTSRESHNGSDGVDWGNLNLVSDSTWV